MPPRDDGDEAAKAGSPRGDGAQSPRGLTQSPHDPGPPSKSGAMTASGALSPKQEGVSSPRTTGARGTWCSDQLGADLIPHSGGDDDELTKEEVEYEFRLILARPLPICGEQDAEDELIDLNDLLLRAADIAKDAKLTGGGSRGLKGRKSRKDGEQDPREVDLKLVEAAKQRKFALLMAQNKAFELLKKRNALTDRLERGAKMLTRGCHAEALKALVNEAHKFNELLEIDGALIAGVDLGLLGVLESRLVGQKRTDRIAKLRAHALTWSSFQRRFSPDEVEVLALFAAYLENVLGYRARTREMAVEYAFRRVDTDQSGTIEKHEWVRVCTVHFNMSPDFAEKVFNCVDIDKGGHIDLAEFKSFCCDEMVKKRTQEVCDMFQAAKAAKAEENKRKKGIKGVATKVLASKKLIMGSAGGGGGPLTMSKAGSVTSTGTVEADLGVGFGSTNSTESAGLMEIKEIFAACRFDRSSVQSANKPQTLSPKKFLKSPMRTGTEATIGSK